MKNKVEIPGQTSPPRAPILRMTTGADTGSVIRLAVAAKMFQPDEVEPLRESLEAVYSGKMGPDHKIMILEDMPHGPAIGVVYFGANPMADRTWDLWMIAVVPERQGQGIGGKMLEFTEAEISASGGRLLLIETSSQPQYDATRAFYAKHRYDEVARIPDFYADGNSKVVFLKRILAKA